MNEADWQRQFAAQGNPGKAAGDAAFAAQVAQRGDTSKASKDFEKLMAYARDYRPPNLDRKSAAEENSFAVKGVPPLVPGASQGHITTQSESASQAASTTQNNLPNLNVCAGVEDPPGSGIYVQKQISIFASINA